MLLYNKVYDLSGLKIRNVDILESLRKDEIFYLYVHIVGVIRNPEILSQYDFPLTQGDFNKIKGSINFKKLNAKEMIQEILDVMNEKYADNPELCHWTYVDIFVNPIRLGEASIFSVVLQQIISYKCSEASWNGDRQGYNILEKLHPSHGTGKYAVKCLKAAAYIRILESREINDRDMKNVLEDMINLLLITVYGNYIKILEENIYDSVLDNGKIVKVVEKLNKELEKKSSKIAQLRETIKELNKQNKNISTSDNSVMETMIKEMSDKLRVIEENSTQLKKDMKVCKSDVSQLVYENQIEKLTTQVSDLKSAIAMKTSECKELRKSIESIQQSIDKSFKDHVLQNGLSDEMREFLLRILASEKSSINSYPMKVQEVEAIAKETIEEITEQKPKIIRNIGYVMIEDGVHKLYMPKKDAVELGNLPDTVYLADGQFVLVDENNNFCRTCNSRYEDNGYSIDALKLCIIESINPLKVRCGSEVFSVKQNFENMKVSLNQVVGVNYRGEIARIFKGVRFTAESHMNSIQARGYNVYFVINVVNSGMFLRNIVTGEEDFYQFDLGEYVVQKGCVLFERNKKVESVISHSKFYTGSAYYSDRIVYGNVIINNGEVCLNKQNGEIVIVKNVRMDEVDNGDVIAIDEFNNYLYKERDVRAAKEKEVVKRSAKNIIGEKNKTNKDIVGEVTIVGNPAYKNGYMITFMKAGYKVNMLDGYEVDEDKVIQTCKNSDALYVVNSYCSHEIYWSMKDNYKNGVLGDTLYFSGKDSGASSLLNKLLEAKSGSKENVRQNIRIGNC